MNHDDFLRAIDRDYRDTGPLLVYADWLEDRGDRLADSIRLLVEAGRVVEGGIGYSWYTGEWVSDWQDYRWIQDSWRLPYAMWRLLGALHWSKNPRWIANSASAAYVAAAQTLDAWLAVGKNPLVMSVSKCSDPYPDLQVAIEKYELPVPVPVAAPPGRKAHVNA